MIKRTLTAVALSSSLVLALPIPAGAVVASSPSPTTPHFDGPVRSVVHKGDTLYVAGDFTSVSGTGSRVFRRDGLAAVSAATGRVLPWAPTVRGTVEKVTVAREGVYLVGDFRRVNGRVRVDVARVDRVSGAVDRTFRHSTDGVVNAIALSRRKVYLGGEFSSFDGEPRGQLAAVGRRGTSRLRAWAPQSAAGHISDLVRRRSGVYVAGSFHRLERTDRSFLALVDEREGRLVRSFKSRVPNVVLDIAVKGRRIYAGTGGRLQGGGAVSVRRSDGSVAFERRFDGDVQAVTTLGRAIYVGGHFTSICRVGGSQDDTGGCVGGPEAERFRGASLKRDGDLTGWDPLLNPEVPSISGIQTFTTYAKSRRLIIGGGFTTSAGADARRLAAYTQG